MKLPPQITWLQYALANTAIVILVPFLALQGMPHIDWAWSWTARSAKARNERPVADWLATQIRPAANLTGVSTASWNMFAPEPDATNHRLRARIEYRDGTVAVWRSPEWPELSCWQRFWTSRELEYIDKIAYNSPPDRWFAFADYLAAQNRKNPEPQGAPQRVTFVKEEAFIANPNIDGWIPMSQPIPRSEEEVISPKRVYPVPLELWKRKNAAPAGRTSP